MFLIFHPDVRDFIKKNWVAITVGLVVMFAVNQKLKKLADGSYEQIERKVKEM